MEVEEFFVIFVWVPACRLALPGDRIAVDTAETDEQQPLRAGRISSKSGVSGSGGVCQNSCWIACWALKTCDIEWRLAKRSFQCR